MQARGPTLDLNPGQTSPEVNTGQLAALQNILEKVIKIRKK